MLTRKSGILALVMGAMVLGACENKAPIVNVTTPTPATTVSIAGAPTAPLKKGQTAQLVAIVANNTNTAVTWSLAPGSATTVVSVSATGLVTALAQGVATVQAVSVADPTAKAAVSISVDTTTVGGGGSIGQPSITISSVTNNGPGTTVNPAAVAGTIDVTLNVDIPTGVTANAVVVKVDGTEVCRQSFAAGGSADAAVEGAQVPQIIVCTINTAALKADGTPFFANGVHTLTAQILNGVQAIATATYQPLVFANASVLAISVAAAKSAQDANGLTWNGGSLTVTVRPQIFNGNTFQSITINVIAKDTTGAFNTISKTVTTTGVTAVTAVFDATATIAAGGLLGLEDAALTVSATAITSVASGGNTFPAAGAFFAGNTLRYDDAAPRLAGVVPVYNTAVQPISGSVYLISTSTFPQGTGQTCTNTGGFTYACGTAGTSAVSATGVVDAGVDVVRMLFQTAPAGTTTWTTQSSYAGIGAQQPGTLQARLQVCDNLDNCKSVTGANLSAAFGVDVLAPTTPVFASGPANNGTQSTTATILITSVDTGAVASGFNLTTGFVRVQITKDSASATGADVKTCVNVATGSGTAPTALPSSLVCATNLLGGTGAATGTFTLDPAVVGFGYFTVVVLAQDVAGNQTTTTQRIYLSDATAPVVSGVTVTYTTGAATASASATIHDNVDLKEWNTREMFSGAITGTANTLPFTAPTTVKAYGIPVQGNVTPSVTVQLVRGVQLGLGGGFVQITGVGFNGVDQANNYGEGYATFTTTASTGITATDVLSSSVSVSPGTICKTAATCTTATTVTAQIVMNANATPLPIQTVYFYYIDAAGRAQWISSTTAAALAVPSSGVNIDKRVYTWTSSALAASLLTSSAAPGTANTVFAVGVDANGNGLLLGTATVAVQP